MNSPSQRPKFLSPDLVLEAYSQGLFPMSESRSDKSIFWVSPKFRGIIPFKNFHVPRSLQKKIKNNVFDIRFNSSFLDVIVSCAEVRRNQDETWINDEIISVYKELHDLGFAHSIECWQKNTLVGGLYGISLGGCFFGESMFSNKRDASKVALVHLVARLIYGNYILLDTQFFTSHLKQFGAIEVSAQNFSNLLENALKVSSQFNSIYIQYYDLNNCEDKYIKESQLNLTKCQFSRKIEVVIESLFTQSRTHIS